MKKSLIAIAVLGAAAFSAQAANVTLYGTVDAGFAYNHIKVKADGQSESVNSFKMADGLNGANKIGIKGEEDLGNMKVGFKLENKFQLSNGALGESSKLFQREARMYVKSDFGEIGAGRFGGLASAAGSYDLFFGEADAFDGGDNAIDYAFSTSDRYNNSIAYQSPEIAGFQGTLMYSFSEKDPQADKMKNNDRYIGAGITYGIENLKLVGVIEGHILSKDKDAVVHKDNEHKNSFTYNLGGNYDFGVAKVFAGGQIARNVALGSIQQGFELKADDAIADDKTKKKALAFVKGIQFNGYALTLGAQIPVAADKITVGAYYGKYKNASDVAANSDYEIDAFEKKSQKVDVYGISARFEHNLSKRSNIYAGAGIGQTKLKDDTKITRDVAQVYVGLHHNF